MNETNQKTRKGQSKTGRERERKCTREKIHRLGASVKRHTILLYLHSFVARKGIRIRLKKGKRRREGNRAKKTKKNKK